MAICCPKSIRGVAVRATLLDDCDRPVDTVAVPNSQIATSGFTSLGWSPDIEAGDTFRRKLANGNVCVNDNEDCDKLVGYTMTLMTCDLPPHFNELLMGGLMIPHISGSGDVTGYWTPDTNFNGNCPNAVTLEVWSQNSDKGKCDEQGSPYRYIRWIFPKVFKWQVSGDKTVNNDLMTEWELTGYAEANPNWISPLGDEDPDIDETIIPEIQSTGGPYGWVCTNELPDPLVDCGYVNPPVGG